LLLGALLGFSDGVSLGLLLGVSLGNSLGALLGNVDGLMLGSLLGELLGADDGFGSDFYLGSCWARSWTKEKMMEFQTGIGLDYCLASRTESY
jgi:hypothetical protein